MIKYLMILILPLILFQGCRDFFGDKDQPESIVNPPESTTNILITSPVFGSVWKPGETMKIKWLANSSVGNIEIELFRKSTFQFKIATETNNDGSYDWNIPANIDNSVQYLLKMYNRNNPDEFSFSERFGIQN